MSELFCTYSYVYRCSSLIGKKRGKKHVKIALNIVKPNTLSDHNHMKERHQRNFLKSEQKGSRTLVFVRLIG